MVKVTETTLVPESHPPRTFTLEDVPEYALKVMYEALANTKASELYDTYKTIQVAVGAEVGSHTWN